MVSCVNGGNCCCSLYLTRNQKLYSGFYNIVIFSLKSVVLKAKKKKKYHEWTKGYGGCDGCVSFSGSVVYLCLVCLKTVVC